MKANKAQEEAIHTINGQMILIACPGSGKTTTLIRRIHYMITEGDISPEHILMITFTKAAADEMKDRYIKMYSKNPGITFCTIHSLCLAIIRKFYNKKLNVISEFEVRNFFQYRIRFLDQINDKDDFINDILLDITVIKNNLLDPKKYTPQCINDKELFLSLYNEYEEYKKEKDQIDFDDMLILAFNILRKMPHALQWIRERFRYIQVDEYQDTNYLQRNIIYMIAGKNGNLVVVGDDDQSIYGFRGARPEIMLNFSKDFPNAKKINMSTNYRSLQSIISCSGKLILHNKKRFEKDFLGSRQDFGEISKHQFPTQMDQTTAVVKEIEKLLKNGVSPNDIAILYRINSEASLPAELLLKKKIPFYCNEVLKSKYEHWIFKDILAYYRLANDQGSKADLKRILNHPNRYFYSNFKNVEPTFDSMYNAATFQKGKKRWQIEKAQDQVVVFFNHLKRLKGQKPHDFLKILYSSIFVNYKSYLKEYSKKRNMEFSDLEDIYSELSEESKLFDNWDDWMKSIEEYNQKIKDKNKARDGVTLSTMHRSKGLEWNHVFIIDCVDGTYPFVKATGETEEERRLFYVAMTRAKDCLYFYSYRKKNNGKDVNLSPFLAEIS